MANSAAICTSFKRELLQGLHALGTTVVRAGTSPDSLKAALYSSSANVDGSWTTYQSTGEVSGTGYTAGGVAVANTLSPASSGVVAYWTPSASLVFSSVTIGPTDCVLLYNSSQGNKAIASYTFSAQTLVAGTLTLTMPANNSSSALIQLG